MKCYRKTLSSITQLWFLVSPVCSCPSWPSIPSTDLKKYWQTGTLAVRKHFKMINTPEKLYLSFFWPIANVLLIRLSRAVLRSLHCSNKNSTDTWILGIIRLSLMTFSHKLKSLREKELPAINLYRTIAWKQVNINKQNRWRVKRAVVDCSQSAKLY